MGCEIGDLSNVKNQEEIKDLIRKHLPEKKKGQIFYG